MFVAVVYCAKNGVVSRRLDGDYSCFIGESRQEAIDKAMAAKHKWDGYKSGTTGDVPIYDVYVGELTTSIKPAYVEEKL